MCYHCHTIGQNRQAPEHRSVNCRDFANKFSQIPMPQRMYYQGKHIGRLASCKICNATLSNMIFNPCGHAATCETCGLKQEVCPNCNQSISDRQKLFSV